jgi:DNA-binding NarL/FixJ family response regulator
MRVLVVDDQPHVGDTLALLVAASRHQVVEVVGSGAAAIRAYHRHRPDIVLMDFSMARLNGGTACRYLLAEDPDARVVFVSSRPVADLVNAGAIAILQKPVGLDQIEELLNSLQKQFLAEKEAAQKASAQRNGERGNGAEKSPARTDAGAQTSTKS